MKNLIATIPTPCNGAGFVMPSFAGAQGGHLTVAAVRERKAGWSGAAASVDLSATAKRTPGTQVWSPPT